MTQKCGFRNETRRFASKIMDDTRRKARRDVTKISGMAINKGRNEARIVTSMYVLINCCGLSDATEILFLLHVGKEAY